MIMSMLLCLQETWFIKQDLANLNVLHPGFHGTGAATVDNRDGVSEIAKLPK